MPPFALAAWQTGIGGITLLPLSAAIEGIGAEQVRDLADPRALIGLFTLVIGGSLVAFPIYLRLVRDWGAFRAGLYAFLSPLVAVAVGVAYAHEAFGWPEAAGMVLMLTATALALQPPEGEEPGGGPTAVSGPEAIGSSPGRPV